MADQPVEGVVKRARSLALRANQGDQEASRRLVVLAEETGTAAVFLDSLARVPTAQLTELFHTDLGRARRLVREMTNHLIYGHWGSRTFDQANTVIRWILHAARIVATAGDADDLAEVGSHLLAADAKWDRWGARGDIQQWLRGLRGEPALVMARLLRINTVAQEHLAIPCSENELLEPALRSVLCPPS